MHIKGKTWTFGRNVNTDLIFPKVWFRPTYEPGEMASHLMVGIDEDFPRKVGRGDVIVGVGGVAIRTLPEFYRKVWAQGAAGTVVPLDIQEDKGKRRVEVKSMNRLDHLKLKSTF